MTTTDPESSADVSASRDADPAIRFAVKLGTALHRYGSPSHRLEDTMHQVLDRLGVESQFFSTPTGIFASFGLPTEQRTTLLRVDPGSVNLEKLELLEALVRDILDDRVTPHDASSRVDAIVRTPDRYGAAITAICFGLSSGAASRFMGGGWREIAASTSVGLLIGILAITSGSRPRVARIFEPASALIASALAVLAGLVFEPLSTYVVTLASLIVLVPGLTLTTAIRELATQNLVSGTARLTGAALLFFEIGFGVALGSRIGAIVPWVRVDLEPLPLQSWTEWVALAVAPVTFMVLFRARPKHIGWILLAGVVSFWGSRLGAFLIGPIYGVCVGALLIGATGNLFARLRNLPAVIMIVPGLMLLVPGSVGFVSITKFLASDVVSGVDAAFRMVLVAVSLVTGLLLANAVVPPRTSV